jgi:hypothetical protein
MSRNNRTVSTHSRRKKEPKTTSHSSRKSLKNKGMRSEPVVMEASKAPPQARTGEFIRRTKIGALNTPAQWLKQLGKVYRLSRRGQISRDDARIWGHLLKMGLDGAKQVEDTKQLEAIRQKLEDIGALPPSMNLSALPLFDHGTEEPTT